MHSTAITAMQNDATRATFRYTSVQLMYTLDMLRSINKDREEMTQFQLCENLNMHILTIIMNV